MYRNYEVRLFNLQRRDLNRPYKIYTKISDNLNNNTPVFFESASENRALINYFKDDRFNNISAFDDITF